MSIKEGSELQRPTGILSAAIHTGIYIGYDEVIHFNSESSKGGKDETVEKCTLKEFSEGQEVSIREEPKDYDHGNRIVKRAKKIMKDKNNKYNGNYGILFGKNCQDFTEDCFINC